MTLHLIPEPEKKASELLRDLTANEINHKIGGNWWVEARILGVFSTGPLLATQKYFADGETFFGKDA
jgi:hypothetical protein